MASSSALFKKIIIAALIFRCMKTKEYLVAVKEHCPSTGGDINLICIITHGMVIATAQTTLTSLFHFLLHLMVMDCFLTMLPKAMQILAKPTLIFLRLGL